MKTNQAVTYRVATHEGGNASLHQSSETELERAVSTCLLFEGTFYEKGSDIADRIAHLCMEVSPEFVSALAVKARTELKLRHVPLFLCVQLLKLKAGTITGKTIQQVVQRPDEMGELIALYRKDGRAPLAAQLKKSLARCFTKFSSYQLSKWDRDAAVKLRDVMFMVHPKPKDDEQAAVWRRLVDGDLASPDTWEVALSSGADKKATWERLLIEKKLGYMALLMNLSNMNDAMVCGDLVEEALRSGAKGSKALPFRFVSAANHAPNYAQALSDAMDLAIEGELPGSTAILVDISGSMNDKLSGKGQMTRFEAAGALAVLIRGVAASCRVFAYSTNCYEIPNLKGFGLLAAMAKLPHKSTNTAASLRDVQRACPCLHRLVVITDEQSVDGCYPAWARHNYIMNVAPYKPGLETNGGWVRINGFSERAVDWIRAHEAAA